MRWIMDEEEVEQLVDIPAERDPQSFVNKTGFYHALFRSIHISHISKRQEGK